MRRVRAKALKTRPPPRRTLGVKPNPMERRTQLFDVVALTEDLPQVRLVRGQVGTVVEQLAEGVFEVEFCDSDGKTYALTAIKEDCLIVLHYDPVAA
jgi:hypothetical protein